MLSLLLSALLASSAQALPTNPVDLAAWAKANGLGFDPNYVHVPKASDILNPKRVTLDADALLAKVGNATDLLSSVGSIPHSRDLQERIIGTDDRYQYTNPNQWPYRTVGKIQWSNGVFCSGSLIGTRHVVTAKHCIPGSGIGLTFSPSFDNGPNPTFGSANAQVFVTTSAASGDCVTKYDHAIIIIDQRYGDGLGYFGAVTPDSSKWNQKIFHNMGYPGDRDNGNRPYRQDGNQLPSNGPHAQLTCDSTGPIYSDSDVAGGQSGSPLWLDSGIIWGICSAIISYSNGAQAAAWASGNVLISMIQSTRNDYP